MVERLPLLIAAISLVTTVHAEPLPAPEPTPADAGSAPGAPPSPSAAEPLPAPDASTSVPPSPAPPPAQVEPGPPPIPAVSGGEEKTAPPKAKKKKKKKKRAAGGETAADRTKNRPRPFEADSGMALGDPWGESPDEFRALGISFRFLLQTHYRETFAPRSRQPDDLHRVGEDTLVRAHDGWDLNRFFFRVATEPSRTLGLKAILDWAELWHKNQKQVIKQAYAVVRPIPKRFHFMVGILKLPYSLLELDPISRYELTRVGEADDLVKGLGFAGRDVGVEMMVAPLPKPKYLHVALGVFRGHAHDEHGAILGAVGARAETEPFKGVRLGANCVAQPKKVTYLNVFDTDRDNLLPNPENPNFPRQATWDKGQAYSADVTFHRWGAMLRTEGMLGTRVDHDTRYGARNFGAAWALVSYRFPVGSIGLAPAARAEWLDTDMEHRTGVHRQLTLGLASYLSPRTRLLVDATRTDVQHRSPVPDQPTPLQAVPYYELSHTEVTGQFQLDL